MAVAGTGSFVMGGGGGVGVTLDHQWEVALKLMSGAAHMFPRAADKALKRIAVGIESDIKSNIKAGPAPPQSPYTTKTGGLGKALNRTGDLGNSPNVVHAAQLAYFIGVPRSNARYNLAVIHEQGAVIVQPLTEKMRRFLFAKLGDRDKAESSGGVPFVVSQIPARPFVEPALDKVRPTFSRTFARHFANALGGKYGKV